MSKLIPALCTLAALWVMGASSLRAETIYAMNYEAGVPVADLFSFDSATPGAITTPQRITGITGGLLLSIALRPADGQLYGFVSGGSVYRIDPATAAATPVSRNVVLSSGVAAIAFSPVTDLLRVISTSSEAQALSFRVNVDTGAVIQDGQSAQPFGLAYTNSYAGASTTTLYALFTDHLTINNPENQSQYNLVGLLGVPGAASARDSLSISGLTGTAYASLFFGSGTSGPYSSQFYTVDLSTGAATLVGPMGDGTLRVAAIAAPVGPAQVAPVPEPASWGLLGAGLLLSGAFRRFRPRYN